MQRKRVHSPKNPLRTTKSPNYQRLDYDEYKEVCKHMKIMNDSIKTQIVDIWKLNDKSPPNKKYILETLPSLNKISKNILDKLQISIKRYISYAENCVDKRQVHTETYFQENRDEGHEEFIRNVNVELNKYNNLDKIISNYIKSTFPISPVSPVSSVSSGSSKAPKNLFSILYTDDESQDGAGEDDEYESTIYDILSPGPVKSPSMRDVLPLTPSEEHIALSSIKKKDYIIENKLSSGGFGTAYVVRDNFSNKFILKELMYNQGDSLLTLIENDIDDVESINLQILKYKFKPFFTSKKKFEDIKFKSDNMYKKIKSRLPQLEKLTNKNYINIISSNIEINVLKFIKEKGCRKDIACYVDDFIDYNNHTICIVTKPFISKNKPAPTLNSLLTNSNQIPFKKSFTIAQNILNAFAYLHSIGISHNDVKPANILLDEESLDIHIIDFGGGCIDKYCIGVSTKGYIHPESHKLHTPYGRVNNKNLDIYSLGLILAQLTEHSDQNSIMCEQKEAIELLLLIDSMKNIDINDDKILLTDIAKTFKEIVSKCMFN